MPAHSRAATVVSSTGSRMVAQRRPTGAPMVSCGRCTGHNVAARVVGGHRPQGVRREGDAAGQASAPGPTTATGRRRDGDAMNIQPVVPESPEHGPDAVPRSWFQRAAISHPILLLLAVATPFVWITQMGSAVAGLDLMPAKLAELLLLVGLATAISRAADQRRGVRQLFAGPAPLAAGLAVRRPGCRDAAPHGRGRGRDRNPRPPVRRLDLRGPDVPDVPRHRRGHGQPVGGDRLGRVRPGSVDGPARTPRGLAADRRARLPDPPPVGVRDRRMVGNHLAERPRHLGRAPRRGALPALSDRNVAHRHRWQHPGRGPDPRLDQCGRRDGRRSRRLAARSRPDPAHGRGRRLPSLARALGHRRVCPRPHPGVRSRPAHRSRSVTVTTVVAGSVAGPVAPHRPATTVLLHLVPGALGLLGYLLVLPVTQALGLPSVAALATVGLIVVPAVQVGALRMRRHRRPLEPVIAYHARLSVPRTLAWATLEIVLAGAAFVLMAPLTRALQTYLLAGWPDAWGIRLGMNGQYGDGALLVTAALLLLGTVIVAPVVEELYFRGYLLPRMPQRLGRWRAPTHVVLFAAYHLWSPWLIPTRVLAILPLAYIAVRTRDVRIGVVTHVVLNATDLVAILLYLQAAPLNGRG